MFLGATRFSNTARLAISASTLAAILAGCSSGAAPEPAAPPLSQQLMPAHWSEVPQATVCQTTKCIYVTNETLVTFHGSVTVYAADAHGNAAPVSEIIGPNTGLEGAEGIAVDSARDIYVTSNASNSVTVYAAGANGDVAPIRTIAGSNTGLATPGGIALDGDGNIYVTSIAANSVTVYAAGANGNVAPIQTITGSSTGLSAPNGIALDAYGRIYVTNYYNFCYHGHCWGSESVTSYAAGANGNVEPIRTIAGSKTGLNGPWGISVGAYGTIFVTNQSGSVLVYARDADGNVAPIRTIRGAKTRLEEPSGIVATNREIYVANVGAGYQNLGHVTVYASGANGNVSPIRIISGRRTQLHNPRFITIR